MHSMRDIFPIRRFIPTIAPRTPLRRPNGSPLGATRNPARRTIVWLSPRLVAAPDPVPTLRPFHRFGFLRGLIEAVKLLVFLPCQARPDRLGRLNRRAAKATIFPTSPPPKGTAFRDCLARQKLTVKTKRSHDALGVVTVLKRPDAAMAAPPSRMTGRTALSCTHSHT